MPREASEAVPAEYEWDTFLQVAELSSCANCGMNTTRVSRLGGAIQLSASSGSVAR